MTRHFILSIELKEPLALTDGSSEGGGHEALSYIPGTSILGACTVALGVKPTNGLFTALFLSEQTRFLNGYPVAAQARMLPRPLTFKTGKLNAAKVHDSIDAAGARLRHEDVRRHFEASNDSMKSTREAFVNESAPHAPRATKKMEQVHVGIDRERRAAEDGVLFMYQSIRSGACFQSVIATDDGAVGEFLAARASKGAIELRLGRSRSAGYGAATATITEAQQWREATQNLAAAAQSTTITLLSDFMPHLEAPPTDAFKRELAGALAIDVKSIEVRASVMRAVRGFRGVWGLPRPTRTALAKGSVCVVTGLIAADRLAAISATGLGARRNEGFGRVACNWIVHGKSSDGGHTDAKPAEVRLRRPASPRPAVGHVASAVETRRNERLLVQFVDAAIGSTASQRVAKALGKVPPAQLGNLRAAMASSMTPHEIGAWFQELAKKTGGLRWKKSTVPSLGADDVARNGIGFVWRSLFGGQVESNDQIKEGTSVDWKSTVAATLCKLVPDETLRKSALANHDRTLRLFVIALCGEVTRTRNLDKRSDVLEAAR